MTSSTIPTAISVADTEAYSPGWLALREPADAAARAVELLEPLAAHLPGRPLVVHDLGCGTGSMGRWLAARLPGPQHWVMHDRDPELLAHAADRMIREAADGAPVTVATRQGDLTRLSAPDLAGASLITASALLDLLTMADIERLVVACTSVGFPALLTLSVAGRVELAPADPLDEEIGAAFNAHQRRDVDGRRLLGPDAVDATADAFARHGATVLTRPSPWRLGTDQAELAALWLRGWVAAATAQRPELGIAAHEYLARRLREARSGHLSITVHHRDLLAVPETPARPAS